jgi:hypothetical protein
VVAETFRIQGVHRDAMPKLLDWCDETSLVDWVQESNYRRGRKPTSD